MSSAPSLLGSVEKTQLVVIGAGPVGLFAGLCAARRGLDVILVEQNFRGCERGHASILHPSSLRLLADLGLSTQLLSAGRTIDRIDLRIDGTQVSSLDLPMPALTIGQSVFEELLLKELRGSDVEIRAPFVATSFEHEPHGVRAHVERREPLGSPAHCAEWEAVEAAAIDAAFVIGADGYNSRVRDVLGIDNIGVGATETFAMFEGPETSSVQDRGSTFELSFGGGLGNILLPLPHRCSRWGFQLTAALNMNADLAQLRELCQRTPWHSARPERVEWSTVTHFERRLARCFGNGRVWLAGDAAHITSPFGGQSMNGGLTEVHALVEHMADCLLAGKPVTDLEQLGAAREREWAKLLGYNVDFQSPTSAPGWLREHARRIIPALPLSGLDLQHQLRELGVTIQ